MNPMRERMKDKPRWNDRNRIKPKLAQGQSPDNQMLGKRVTLVCYQFVLGYSIDSILGFARALIGFVLADDVIHLPD